MPGWDHRYLLLVCLLLCSGIPAHADEVPNGKLLSATPVNAPLAGLPPGASAWRILYQTRNHAGQPILASALLVAPAMDADPAQRRKIVVWAHGTVGVMPDCAPSIRPGAVQRLPGVAAIVRRGWVMVAPDYPGLGTIGPHAYLDRAEVVAAILDAVRAASQVNDAMAGPEFIVWGHSQGGHAALATALEPDIAPDLILKGVVAVAPPTDLVENTTIMARMMRGVLTSMAMTSWSRSYGSDLSELAPFIDGIARVGRSCADAPADWIDNLRTLMFLVRFRNVDMAWMPDWRAILARHSIPPTGIRVPVLLTQGTDDVIVPAVLTRRWMQDACRTGAVLSYVEVAGGDHEGNARATLDQSLVWIADRFSDRPPPDDCGRVISE